MNRGKKKGTGSAVPAGGGFVQLMVLLATFDSELSAPALV